MKAKTDYIRQRREMAWAYGRDFRERLLARYKKEYGVRTAPPPAVIIDELLTDFLGAELRYDPLPADLFAQTELVNDRPVVTINSLTGSIRGVRDAVGVQNVGKWHEAIHVVDHLKELRSERCGGMLPGFGPVPRILCSRSGAPALTSAALQREFWAEEAGRAAAVSIAALSESEAFTKLCRLASRSHGPVVGGWPLLYRAAQDIGVNITSLFKQLTLEGRVVETKDAGRSVLYVQPAFVELLEAG